MWWFSGWSDVLRILAVGAAAYLCLVFALRIAGPRSLSKFNAFDLVVTVALGSTLASTLLNDQVSLTNGLTALAVLIGLQFLVSWGASRSRRFNRAIKAEPVLVFRRGQYLDRQLRKARLTRDELLAVMRSNGVADPEEIEAIVLESDGSLTLMPRGAEGPPVEQVRLPQ